MKQLLFTLMGLSILSISYGQDHNNEDHDQIPKKDSPLMRLVKNKVDKKINFNSIDLSEYENTTDYDLDRKTDFELLKRWAKLTRDVKSSLDTDSVMIDGMTFYFYGNNSFVSLGKIDLQIGSQRIDDANKFLLTENYDMISSSGDTVVTYKNLYYTFFKDELFIMDVFAKQRLLKGNLTQNFEGISFNENVNGLSIFISPNPATDNTEIRYELIEGGEIQIQIMNAQGTLNKTIVAAQRKEEGIYKEIISLRDYLPGVYTVSVIFKNKRYSSTLIKL